VVTLTGNAEGILAQEGEVTIPLQATCPKTAGDYSSTVGLAFSREDGKPVSVEVPAGVDVILTCTDDREITIYRQSHHASAYIIYPFTERFELYRSEDNAGAGEHHLRDRLWDEIQQTITPIVALGYGEVKLNATVAGSYTYTDPFTSKVRTRSATAVVSYISMSAYQKPTATFTGTIASTISESEKYAPIPNSGPTDQALGAPSITFELATSATIDVNWSCDGQFLPHQGLDASIRLTRTTPGQPTLVVFDRFSVPGCHYSGPLAPGRYVFSAAAGTTYGDLQAGANSASQEATYSMTITIVE
jgi:hypothetical protein